MLGWSFETCLAPRTTRNRSCKLSPVVLDAPLFYVGLLSLFLNSHRFSVALPCAPFTLLGLWPRIAGSQRPASLEIYPRVIRAPSRLLTQTYSGDPATATLLSHLNRSLRWFNARSIAWIYYEGSVHSVSTGSEWNSSKEAFDLVVI